MPYNETFTVVLTLRNGHHIEQSTHVVDAPSEKEAVRTAFESAIRDYPNARAAGEIMILGHVVFPGAHTPSNAYNEDPFDFEGQSPGVPDDEKGLFQAVIGGQNVDSLAIMNCWLDREPTWAIVAVEEDSNEQVDIRPLYIRLTEEISHRIRASDGEPLLVKEAPETPGDPSLH